MYDPPAYLWAITITGPTAIVALTCVALYGGAARAGLGRGRAALLAGLPLALIPTATVPLLLALHITSVSTLGRVARPVSLASRPQPPSATGAAAA